MQINTGKLDGFVIIIVLIVIGFIVIVKKTKAVTGDEDT